MKRFLVVGLGNPGRNFEQTRHNLGIRALRYWLEGARQHATHVQDWRDGKEAAAAQLTFGETQVVLLFPLTYMNTSGHAVAITYKNMGLTAADILIVHDELELPFGDMHVQKGGSAHGHKGVKSIHEALGTRDIARLRLGIGRPENDMPIDEYVLTQFSPAEEVQLETTTLPVAAVRLTDLLSITPPTSHA